MSFLSLQEIFTKVKDHLLAQNAKALATSDGFTCAYRGHNNLKCAAGVLIKDEHYHPAMEDKFADHPRVAQGLIASGVNMNDQNVSSLVRGLQTIHDTHPVTDWGAELVFVAKYFKLKY